MENKENGPKTINDVKLINAGKILENNKTLAESRSPVSEIPGGVITMLVVLRPPMADKNSGKFVYKLTNFRFLIFIIIMCIYYLLPLAIR
ncbi:putative Ubiquitin-like domain superfamily, UBL3-like, ubiquitin domain-containing protein [Helianthus annuus]|nr:putative Ubiquitin-like domain superfamily, UBL3-like, ubiquitin domain-containing protein [Helianthus annuus]KAJ0586186.1 putative Ubiquitin-like domain superfamily, UBL3-like, ubiquitin domain-containing protein [Helianthus annuus]KAJ0748670.1 putative Ubiquitin-like domain superfamily, UBL3-like, ubiquitin domain-containing protein [Helianthus annuus]